MQEEFQNLSKEHLSKISILAFEQSFNSIVITTADVDDPHFVYVNPAFCKQTGYSSQEVLGKNPKILQGPNTDRKVIEKLKQCLKDKKFFQGQTVNYKKDGSEYHVQWNISPLFGDSGELLYFVSFQLDISSKVELERKNQELLIQQSRLAAVGELMNTVAHQWKQPLGIISGMSQIIKRKLSREFIKEELVENIDIVVEQTQFMADTITTFQHFLRPTDLHSTFELNRAIVQTVALVQGELLKHKIELECNLVDACIINGSENEFKQVILNLLSNAKDAFVMNDIENQRTIKIDVTHVHDIAQIDVVDNAGGIKLLPIEKVFENNISTKGDKGTGIGLYIVKQIIERLQGNIDVALVGEDSTKFTIQIPIQK